MGKNPAFPFYASDFLVDVSEMTPAEIGYYVQLLCLQWVNGHINSDPNRLANRVGIGLLEAWPEVSKKFETCEDGNLRNTRMESVRREREEHRRKQSEAGKLGAQRRWAGKNENSNPNGNPINNPINNPNGKNITHREDEKEIEDRISNTGKGGLGEKPIEALPPDAIPEFLEAYGDKATHRTKVERPFVEAAVTYPPEFLIQRAEEYAAFCKETARPKKDPQNWLNDKDYLTDWTKKEKNGSNNTGGKGFPGKNTGFHIATETDHTAETL